jgi:hypothetical protein|tara:strand:- start:773 stop:946 length:174 start_codon:yes stop_codon:yes gene_type:complete
MTKRKSKLIMCENCNNVIAVIVHNHTYYCADCALFEMGIPFKKIMSIEDKGLSRKKQ